MQQFRAIVESDEYADAALQICWRATHDVNRVDALLNASTARQAQFLRVLGQSRELDAARVEWGRIATVGRTVEVPLVSPYVEALIETWQLDQAAQVWRRLLDLNGIASDYVAPDNLFENGSFEQPLLNSGFDWRRIPLPAVFVSLDSLAFHSGRQALFFQFDNSQDSDLGVWQLVRVAPGRHYHFNAWVRSEELLGAHGPRIAVEDAGSAAPLFLSDAAAGSSTWREIEGEFTASTTTSGVRIHLVRTPPATPIEGRLWMDDVSITAE